jgi:epoxyqueuosine reductase QueG
MGFVPQAVLDELYQADQDRFFDHPAQVAVFDPPLVGVARADDPLFARIKEMLGEFYWTPQEALALAAPRARSRSVICWVLPVAEQARRQNRRQKDRPGRLWAYMRSFGEEFNTRLRHGLVARLRMAGYAAIAPAVAPQNLVEDRPGVGLSSSWSERHTAFVAGLGTFGLSGGLITRRGIAHRLGSVVTDADLPATPRPYGEDHTAWCLNLSRGLCGACMRRCPVGAIGPTLADRNKGACRVHSYQRIAQLGLKEYGFAGTYGCGLCQTAVPCEDRNPTEEP